MTKSILFTITEQANIKNAFEKLYQLLIGWESQISNTGVGSLIHGLMVSNISEEHRKKAIKLTEKFSIKKAQCRSYAKLLENRYVLAECLNGRSKTVESVIELIRAIVTWVNYDGERYIDSRSLGSVINRDDIFALSNTEAMSIEPILDLIESECAQLFAILDKPQNEQSK